MKILIVGGGSGGHVTPAIAVAREILRLRPRAEVEFWTDRKYWANVEKITTLGEDEGQLKMKVRKVVSGKFRRYSGWKMKDYIKLWRITLGELVLKNIGNGFLFLFGIGQSYVRLLSHKNRPDAIFLKGGYVGLPVGIVAGWLGIPYVIHESDAAAGLANRLLMRKATVVATGFPTEESEKVKFVGIPVGDEFRKVTESQQRRFKKELGFSPERSLVVITGGSQGSERINQAVTEVLSELLKTAEVGIVVGRKHKEKLEELRKFEKFEEGKLTSGFRAWEFNSNMRELLGAADVVVSRAGATTIAELSALEKAVILIPFADLPNSHQMKNAERLAEAGAVRVVNDEEMTKKPEELLTAVAELVRRPAERKKLAGKLHEEIFKEGKGAAERLAEIVVEVGGGRV
ncbi:UDP-N-acetylglucosamine--N-acetylmuramyl-(pentapeptide) pyrophosphoryl-undecaprenol N-acetylglucosamine transferase [Candidatus Saccharibacteria bacterium]|nr:UDP-N-acetylglucosamine--N-acetylmuramyl-(pentapeptide) pyrophosphoryl-undecaprenol N-acetylglucosamine transferase [Candidatus Saccharibacteria bacterium]